MDDMDNYIIYCSYYVEKYILPLQDFFLILFLLLGRVWYEGRYFHVFLENIFWKRSDLEPRSTDQNSGLRSGSEVRSNVWTHFRWWELRKTLICFSPITLCMKKLEENKSIWKTSPKTFNSIKHKTIEKYLIKYFFIQCTF